MANTTSYPISNEPKKKNDDRTSSSKHLLAKYRGKEQLLNPTVFNMRKVREAKLPSANGHASAKALATVFDSIFDWNDNESTCVRPRPLLRSDIIELARTPCIASTRSIDKGEFHDNVRENIGQSI